MKKQLVQFVSLINKIDRRHLQVAYVIVMLGGAILFKGPSDGSIGPY